jgi:hypothetical protein
MRLSAAILASSAVLFASAQAQESGAGRLESAMPGIQTAKFDTLSGTVSVHLPEEIAAGDTISGTVVAEPAGDKEKKREKNLGTLSGYVLEIEEEDEDEDETVADGRLTVHLPSTPSREAVVTLVLRELRKGTPGQEIGRVDLPLQTPAEAPSSYRLPTMGQTGRSAIVHGPFDGDLATSGLTVGDVEALPLAESPRMAVFRSPHNVVGVAPIELRERGETVAEGEIRNVAVSLSAPKTSLIKGESTTLTTTVLGLEDLEEEIPLELDTRPASVVDVEGGSRHNLVIRPEDVDANGTYSLRLRVTGRRAGGWNAEATVVVPEPEPPAERFILVLEGDTVGYLQSVSGGTISGDPERITFEAGLELKRPLYDWMRASFDKGHVRKSGEIRGCDSDGNEREVHEFYGAIIESVTFPQLDSDDGSPAYMTITLAPETVRFEKGSGERAAVAPSEKKWLGSNFRFELGELSVERVSRIDSFTWKQGVTRDEVGRFREPTKHPARVEAPDPRLLVSTTDVGAWQLWHRTFVDPEQRNVGGIEGRLVFLAPDRVAPLATIELYDAALASLEIGSTEMREQRVTIELVDSRMSFVKEVP